MKAMPRPDKGTRDKLIDTASDLIWASSYGAVSVDEICQAANVRKGSFYHYFPSKQDLAVAAMERHFDEELEPDLKRIFAANIPFMEQIGLLAESVIAKQKAARDELGCVCGCPFAAIASELLEDHVEIRSKVEELFGRCRSYLGTAIKSANDAGIINVTDPASKTSEIHDFITGMMLMARVHNSLEGLERDLHKGILRLLGVPYETAKEQKRI
jgi:TetR/AcrR family transcriptional repressor of nem operon